MSKRFKQEQLTPHYWLVSSIVPDLGPGLWIYSSGEDGRVLHTSVESGMSTEVWHSGSGSGCSSPRLFVWTRVKLLGCWVDPRCVLAARWAVPGHQSQPRTDARKLAWRRYRRQQPVLARWRLPRRRRRWRYAVRRRRQRRRPRPRRPSRRYRAAAAGPQESEGVRMCGCGCARGCA